MTARRWMLALGLGAALFVSVPAVASASVSAPRYIVVLKDSAQVTPAAAAAAARSHGAHVSYVYTHALRGYAAALPRPLLRQLRASSAVSFIQRDLPYTIEGSQSNPPSYGLDRIDQRNLPLNNLYVYPRTGSGVDAYGIDTGVRITHQQFGGRAVYGYDSVDGSLPADDCNGHGTHTAGTMGGSLVGVAKGVHLIAVRVLDCGGSGSSAGIVAGMDWVVGDHQAGHPAVANMSLGSNGVKDSAIDAAANRMVADGISLSVSAGNGVGNGLYQQNACNSSPANVPAALTVSDVNNADQKPLYANIGTCVDLFAPGENIISTWNTDDTATASDSGTSMASPHVAGAAALYLEANPSATPADVANAIKNNATAGVVKSPGSGSPNRLLYVGFISPGSGGNQAPIASFNQSCPDLSCSFTDTSFDSDGSIASRSWTFGDGGTSTAQNPSHTYAAAGTYTVTLTVTDNLGATGTTSHTVTVSATGGDPDPSTPTLQSGVAQTGTGPATGAFKYYKVAIPTGASSVKLDLTGPACGLLQCNPDFDLYGRNGSKPTTTAYNCSSATGSNTETCTISAPPAGYVYVGVYKYSGSATGNFTVKATVT
jgi:subtilisin family serine protease